MIEKDTSRVRYLSPEEGVEYGLIDKVLYPQELRVQVRKMLMIDFLHRVQSVFHDTTVIITVLLSISFYRRQSSSTSYKVTKLSFSS